MKQYIDKDVLIAEIESKKKRAQILGDNAINGSMQQFYDGMKQGCVDILSLLNTLEVKDVDLEKEFNKCCENYIFDDDCDEYIARRFFELGLKAQKGE